MAVASRAYSWGVRLLSEPRGTAHNRYGGHPAGREVTPNIGACHVEPLGCTCLLGSLLPRVFVYLLLFDRLAPLPLFSCRLWVIYSAFAAMLLLLTSATQKAAFIVQPLRVYHRRLA